MKECRKVAILVFDITPTSDHQFQNFFTHPPPSRLYNSLSFKPNHPLMIFLESPYHFALISTERMQKSASDLHL
jgi:hypothetical protein